MKYVLIVFLTLAVDATHATTNSNPDFVYGRYGLHFNEDGRVIKPDEYYFHLAAEAEMDGLKVAARKNFQRVASYGNTYGFYYTALLYMQSNDYVKGHAWLSFIKSKQFEFYPKVTRLKAKLEKVLSTEQLQSAQQFKAKLDEVYGVQATFDRRKKWSKSFKLGGTHIRGHVPNFLSIQTRFVGDQVNTRGSGDVSAIQLRKTIRGFVYEYDMDLRIEAGEVILNDLELNGEPRL